MVSKFPLLWGMGCFHTCTSVFSQVYLFIHVYFFRSAASHFTTTLPWIPLLSSVNTSTSSRVVWAVQNWRLNTVHGWLNSECRRVMCLMFPCKSSRRQEGVTKTERQQKVGRPGTGFSGCCWPTSGSIFSKLYALCNSNSKITSYDMTFTGYHHSKDYNVDTICKVHSKLEYLFLTGIKWCSDNTFTSQL